MGKTPFQLADRRDMELEEDFDAGRSLLLLAHDDLVVGDEELLLLMSALDEDEAENDDEESSLGPRLSLDSKPDAECLEMQSVPLETKVTVVRKIK